MGAMRSEELGSKIVSVVVELRGGLVIPLERRIELEWPVKFTWRQAWVIRHWPRHASPPTHPGRHHAVPLGNDLCKAPSFSSSSGGGGDGRGGISQAVDHF
ncbi:hypothetical protein NL676_035286 [Syzygium grande]|nr:hypothetical protein NL676_035286 [Syzygium grande]